jgi:Rrf2 family protein
MLKFSKKTEYGLRAMLYLAQTNSVVPIQNISAGEDISHTFLEQIIYELKQSGLVISQRGASGGYALAKSPQEINLGDIVRSLEKEIAVSGCVLEDVFSCPRHEKCLAKNAWFKIQKELLKSVNNISLQDLLDDKLS